MTAVLLVFVSLWRLCCFPDHYCKNGSSVLAKQLMSLKWNPFSLLYLHLVCALGLNLIILPPVKILDSFTLSLHAVHKTSTHWRFPSGTWEREKRGTSLMSLREMRIRKLCIMQSNILYLVQSPNSDIIQSSRGSRKYWMNVISDFHSKYGIRWEQIRIVIWNCSQM